jgi:hypothetical protein
VIKEKWDEVNRLRKRRIRWTIGREKIEVRYDVGTNVAALSTVNVMFHSSTGRRHLRVTRSFISSSSSASIHSLPCGPRMTEEKDNGWAAPSRFKSAGARE